MSKVVLSNNNKITNRPSSKCEATPQAYSKQQRKEMRRKQIHQYCLPSSVQIWPTMVERAALGSTMIRVIQRGYKKLA